MDYSADTNALLRQRVLCLHGSHQSASVFQGRLDRLEAALPQSQVDLVYLDGPHFLPLSDGDTVQMRTWFSHSHAKNSVEGARCVCEALSVFDRVWRRYGPFDGCIGFSAGGLASCIIASLPDRYPGLSWTMISGTPNLDQMLWCSCSGIGNTKLTIPAHLKSLHIFGKQDTLVPPQDRHSVPMRRAEIDQYLTFIHQNLRAEEIESLNAIYPDEVSVTSSTEIGLLGGCQIVAIKIPLEDTRFNGQFEVCFRLSPLYPNAPPSISIRHTMGMLEFSSTIESSLIKTVTESIQPLLGSPMIFDAISTTTQFLQDYTDPDPSSIDPKPESDIDNNDSDPDEEIISASTIGKQPLADLKSKNARGKWCHTIGLVGKPSAGKSTFFNAATRMPAKYVPRKWVEEGREVLIPCVIKDVAGLVPGHGKGEFLNDLCDADVLIHIIDASGLSDSDGNILPLDTPTPQDPLHDIHWVRAELFHWILNNITKKWDSIIKRPNRLPAMFSGYQAPRWLVSKVLIAAGFDVSVGPQYAKQFPMLLAMNKADLGPAEAICACEGNLWGQFVVPVCAASETWLQAQVELGAVDYRRSKVAFEVEKDEVEWKKVEGVVEKFNGTGVDAALTAAIMLRAPVFCFPVEDLESLALCSCLPMKPGSTVFDVFELLAHGPEAVLNGQFVRAEAVALDGSGKRPVKKDTEIDENSAIVKLMSNRKSRWQQG
ncbi:P-loop containing nucleoside triphosphate hydrolase protein [Rhizoclosmatium globosum]|uniref:p-loop containing nucleoside triphosphate hydrolase protein n=1 Tax=Rhizoclosmatium globosum TaxID=329046 RepID=A0A1Y2CS89_9FUNG|nr:P-loop containing nucleoside triphosphate hydrolase protein [Rhizoclosmatium globosum]|eukprot:ORY49930.1 P-loop containing nucleoside triphosphate hydrolase protein [Rhizoclosmatium globosum]